MLKNPKVIVLPSFYPMTLNYTRGGFFEEQARLVSKSGADVSVVFNEDRSLKSFSLKKLRYIHFQTLYQFEEELPVFRKLSWNIIPTKFKLGRRLWVESSIKLVKQYIGLHGKPEVFHVHCAFNAGAIALYFKKSLEIPYIVTEHSTLFALDAFTPELRKEVLEIYDNARSVIVVSNPFRKLLSEKTGFDANKISVIPNFIDTDFFDPSKFDEDYSLNKTIFTVCHHESKKRLDRLIDAFSIASERYPDWQLIIGGHGSESDSLKLKVLELKLTNKVSFTGFLSKDEVRSYLNKSSFFVLPSQVETFGVVIIEAMAMGLPVVATACGGPEDIITNESGILVERNVNSLAEGIMTLIRDRGNYDKDLIRSYIIDNFSGYAIAKKYKALYSDSV